MFYKYILENYKNGEPIFLNDLEMKDKNAKQYVNNLIKAGKLKRYINGVYYLPYVTMFGTEGKLGLDTYIKRKYIEDKNGNIFGYLIGGQLANYYGTTTQHYQSYELRTNIATTDMRKFYINNRKIIIRKPFVEINNDNYKVLQFIDMIYAYDEYNEYEGNELLEIVARHYSYERFNINDIKKYVSHFPDKIYKKLFEGGFYELLER